MEKWLATTSSTPTPAAQRTNSGRSSALSVVMMNIALRRGLPVALRRPARKRMLRWTCSQAP